MRTLLFPRFTVSETVGNIQFDALVRLFIQRSLLDVTPGDEEAPEALGDEGCSPSSKEGRGLLPLALAPAEQRAVMCALLRQRPHGRSRPYCLAGQFLAACLVLLQLAHLTIYTHLSLLDFGVVYVEQEDM